MTDHISGSEAESCETAEYLKAVKEFENPGKRYLPYVFFEIKKSADILHTDFVIVMLSGRNNHYTSLSILRDVREESVFKYVPLFV